MKLPLHVKILFAENPPVFILGIEKVMRGI